MKHHYTVNLNKDLVPYRLLQPQQSDDFVEYEYPQKINIDINQQTTNQNNQSSRETILNSKHLIKFLNRSPKGSLKRNLSRKNHPSISPRGMT